MAGILTANLVLQKTKLDNLKHVRKLNVCGVHVSDISVLRDAKNVEVLSLSVNEITDLEPLSACGNLREVYLRRNDIGDVHQVLHLARLPFLSSLTLSDNPIAQDPNYRKFCVAALPSLVRFDDIDVSPSERADAERTFPDLAHVAPPTPLLPAASSCVFGTPPRPSTSGSYSPSAARSSAVLDDVPVGSHRRGRGGVSGGGGDRLARKFQELSSQFDDMPVGGRSSMHSARASRSTGAAAGGAVTGGPREDGVVAAVKLLLDELSPAALLEVRRYVDLLGH